MRERLCTILAAVTAVYFLQVHVASGTELARSLHGKEMKAALIGNTLIGADGEDGVSWVYFPNADVLWGQSPSGDVDIGRWWIENESYCRAWRRWLKGETQCWQLASADDGRILWYSLAGGMAGRSLLWHGNALGNLSDRFLTQTADQTGSLAADRNESEAQPGPAPRPREQLDSEQGFTAATLERETQLHVTSPTYMLAATDSDDALRMPSLSSSVTGRTLQGRALDSGEALSHETAEASAPAPAAASVREHAAAQAAAPASEPAAASVSEHAAAQGSGLAHDSSGDIGRGGSQKDGGIGRGG
jgi:hypothetical protein